MQNVSKAKRRMGFSRPVTPLPAPVNARAVAYRRKSGNRAKSCALLLLPLWPLASLLLGCLTAEGWFFFEDRADGWDPAHPFKDWFLAVAWVVCALAFAVLVWGPMLLIFFEEWQEQRR